jgi:hypothetical protein
MPSAKPAHLAVHDLKKEISRRQKALAKLIAKRDHYVPCAIDTRDGLRPCPLC